MLLLQFFSQAQFTQRFWFPGTKMFYAGLPYRSIGDHTRDLRGPYWIKGNRRGPKGTKKNHKGQNRILVDHRELKGTYNNLRDHRGTLGIIRNPREP